MTHSTTNGLLYAGLVLILVHFYFFNKTMKMISQGERDRYVHQAGSKRSLMIALILFACLFYFKGLVMNLLISSLIVTSTAIDTILHHKKLRALNFDEVFEKRLLKISFVSLIGVILILGSITLDTYAT